MCPLISQHLKLNISCFSIYIAVAMCETKEMYLNWSKHEQPNINFNNIGYLYDKIQTKFMYEFLLP
jgi:hypothetical protein